MTDRRTLSRRAFLGAAAGGAAVVGAAGLATSGGFGALAAVVGGEPAAATGGTFPFTGAHQAGIVTPAQDRMYTAAFDLTTTSRDELIALLRSWTTMAARLSAGLSAGPFGPASGPYDAPPDDTGEAQELGAAGRTRRATGSASPIACPRPWSRFPTFRATTSSRCAATATSSSRPARMTRRSRCTLCAT
jgi:deferrochelatase/peroxidase EfeB